MVHKKHTPFNVISEVKGITINNAKDGYVEVETGSGEYHFIIQQ